MYVIYVWIGTYKKDERKHTKNIAKRRVESRIWRTNYDKTTSVLTFKRNNL